MKIVVFGARGMIGRRVVQEALSRGHEVIAVSRDPAKLDLHLDGLKTAKGDITDPASVSALARGQDAVVSSIRADRPDGADLIEAAKSLVDGLRRAGTKRVLAVGGVGMLEVAPGVRLVDAPDANPRTRPHALAHWEAADILRQSDLDWSYVSPPQRIAPGERTGKFRLGGEQLLRDAEGKSAISAEDFAIGIVDELEEPQHIRRRFTMAY